MAGIPTIPSSKKILAGSLAFVCATAWKRLIAGFTIRSQIRARREGKADPPPHEKLYKMSHLKGNGEGEMLNAEVETAAQKAGRIVREEAQNTQD